MNELDMREQKANEERDLRARAERAEAERDDLRCLLRAREEWIHGRLGDGCPHTGCPQCDAAFPAEAFGLAPGFGYSLIDAARKLVEERDAALARLAKLEAVAEAARKPLSINYGTHSVRYCRLCMGIGPCAATCALAALDGGGK